MAGGPRLKERNASIPTRSASSARRSVASHKLLRIAFIENFRIAA